MSTLTLLLPSFALFGFAGVLLTQALWCVTGIAALIVRPLRASTLALNDGFCARSGSWC
jgi:hypothetical protein